MLAARADIGAIMPAAFALWVRAGTCVQRNPIYPAGLCVGILPATHVCLGRDEDKSNVVLERREELAFLAFGIHIQLRGQG